MTSLPRRAASALTGALLVVGVLSATVGAADAASAPAASALPLTCEDLPVRAGQMTCMSQAAPIPVAAHPQAMSPNSVSPVPAGLRPADIQSLYGLPSGGAGAGTGPVVALIEAGSSPTLAANLSAYRTAFGLPACTADNGCLTQIGQTGTATLPAPVDGWDFEINMDAQAVSAACPACRILVVEANSSYTSDLDAGVRAALARGVQYISMSYGSVDGGGSSAYATWESTFSTPGVTFVASSGDTGYAQLGSDPDAHGGITCGAPYASYSCAEYPSTSPHVVSAGGTSVSRSGGTWQQTTWVGAGSGCSNTFARPVYQAGTPAADLCGGKRASSDVSALADPDSGMLIYYPGGGSLGGWLYGGGTSLAAPLLSSMYALAGNHTNPFAIYARSKAQYDGVGTAVFNDITADGSTGGTHGCDQSVLCHAVPRWDGASGVGTPASVSALSADAPAARTVALRDPASAGGPATATVGNAVSWDASATDDGTYSYTAAGLPSGLTLNSHTGLVTGAPTAGGTGQVTVTAKGATLDGLTPTGSVSFGYAISAAVTAGGGGGGGAPDPTPTPSPTLTPGPPPAPQPIRDTTPVPPTTVTTAIGAVGTPKIRVKGASRAGRKITARYGTYVAHDAQGHAVIPNVTVTWYVNGKALHRHGAKLKLKKSWKGKRVSFHVTLTAPGCAPVTVRSASTKVT